ncbi:hypothetical protein OC844_004250 [Tilletia horrida]|nr:hypothetical protein OC844_004250 [Tilletia horrida]
MKFGSILVTIAPLLSAVMAYNQDNADICNRYKDACSSTDPALRHRAYLRCLCAMWTQTYTYPQPRDTCIHGCIADVTKGIAPLSLPDARAQCARDCHHSNTCEIGIPWCS